MQEAGGIDYLVGLTEKMLRRYPRLLVITAPLSTWLLTMMASTGQVSFACMPVIVGVAKENQLRPTRALALSVTASLLGIVPRLTLPPLFSFQASWKKNHQGSGIFATHCRFYTGYFISVDLYFAFLPVLGQTSPE